jgi:fatty-acyl-CoA synthase
MLEGLMQDFPLTVAHIRRRVGEVYGDQQVITHTEAGRTVATYADLAERVDRLGRVLARLGVAPGERVATFAWNSQRHLELYFAIPSAGAVLHTLNIRLFPEHLEYIINHAEDQIIFVDDSVAEMLAPLAGRLGTVRHFVVMGDGDASGLPNALRYEELMEDAGPGAFDWPEVDERAAAALCYTSGTTGNPKGVLYSQRSIALHAMATGMADALALSSEDRILVVVPMFHANAWGLPFGGAMTGARLILPTRLLQAPALAGFIEQERCTRLAAVPTIFLDLLRYADEQHPDLSSLNSGLCGGSAVPRSLAQAFEERHGVRILQAWGMTETSPLCTVARAPKDSEGEDYWFYRASQGRVIPFVEMRVVDDDAKALPWDGESTGEIEVRGPWIASRYFNDPTGDVKFDQGWLRTGDIGTVDQHGYMRISDRAKDVIKSGGEWISSVELENEIMAHPDVVEAAVIAQPHERWAERPLACVVLREGARCDAAQLLEHLRPRVAKWWLPDAFAFIEEVPKTSVGKFDKKVLRARLADGTLATQPARERAAQVAG